MADLGTGRAWELHPSVGLRPEPFGALAYHYGTRRLTFLKDRVLTDLVRALGDHDDIPSTLAALDVPAERRGVYVAALSKLAEAGIIRERSLEPEVVGVR